MFKNKKNQQLLGGGYLMWIIKGRGGLISVVFFSYFYSEMLSFSRSGILLKKLCVLRDIEYDQISSYKYTQLGA